MRFSFEAVNAAGIRERGEVEAIDERAALKVLASRGQTALHMQPKSNYWFDGQVMSLSKINIKLKNLFSCN